jgi:hypothetical protein
MSVNFTNFDGFTEPSRHDILFLASSKYPKHAELPDNATFVSNVPLQPVCFTTLSKEDEVSFFSFVKNSC